MATQYFITISPQYRAIAPALLYEQDKYDIYRLLNPCSHHFCLYPEFDKNSRLHYHGIIRIDDPIKWHKTKHIIDRVLGWTVIKPIESFRGHLTALVYSYKQWANNRSLFKEPIMYKRRTKPKVINEHYLDSTDVTKKTIFDYFK